MDRCDFSSIMTIFRSYIRENNQLNQVDFLYELFDDFLAGPEGQDFSFDNGLVCRWLAGQARVSPKLINYYSITRNQERLSHTIHQTILPMMFDYNKALEDVYILFIQDSSISDEKKCKLSVLYNSVSTKTLFLAKLIAFGMERTFIKRDRKNQKLIAGGSLSPVLLDYIMDSEVPQPCRHFCGRVKEIETLHTMLEENSHVFLYGIAGIGKSELSKAYAKQYRKYYTNILFLEYGGNLKQSVIDMDFTDDLMTDTDEERFKKHHRFLRTLRNDTLLIIDNFNTTPAQESFLSVMLKYRCRILFTTRSKFDGHSLMELKEIADKTDLFQLVSTFYSEAERFRNIVEEIIDTVHGHTFAVELAAKLLENGILPPGKLSEKLREEKATLENTDKISVIKDGQSSKATYYKHIHTLFSLYMLSENHLDIMRNMCFLPLSGISARIFAGWIKQADLNNIHDLTETGFVQSNAGYTIFLHPMIQEISVAETKPSVTNCRTMLDALKNICLQHGLDIVYHKKLFQTVENIISLIKKDDIPYYLLFLEDIVPYMEKYHYDNGIFKIIQELQLLLKDKNTGTISDRALLLNYQASVDNSPKKAIKLEKEAIRMLSEITTDTAHLASNLHANLGSLYRLNAQPELAREHMEQGISILEQYGLCYTNDVVPQTCNYAVLLTEMGEPENALSALRKLSKTVKKYNSDICIDYAQILEAMGGIFLLTGEFKQATTHFKKATHIYEIAWANEPELIEAKYQEIAELYPQTGIAIGKKLVSMIS